MASIHPPADLLDRPLTLDALLDLAHHVLADILFDSTQILTPLVGGFLPFAHLHVLRSPTPICTLDFLSAIQQAFRAWDVDRYFYVTPTLVQEHCVDPALSNWLQQHEQPTVTTLPAIFTMAVSPDGLATRYLSFDQSGEAPFLSTLAQHQYAAPEHFQGPYSRLLSAIPLDRIPPLVSNPSLQ